MANAFFPSASASRMQTNADWQSPAITFYAGSPAAAVDMSGWTVDGVALGAKGQRVHLDIDGGKLSFDSTTALRVNLTTADMALLGVGCVEIEIMRRTPSPVRPIVRLSGVIHPGL